MPSPSERSDVPPSPVGTSLSFGFGITVFFLYVLYEFVAEPFVEEFFLLNHVEHLSEKFESVAAVGVVLLLAGFLSLRIEREKAAIARRLAESEERLARITDATQDAIVMIDADFTVTFWSRSAERLFGVSLADAMGAFLPPLLAPPAMREELVGWLVDYRDKGDERGTGEVLSVTPLRRGRRPFAADVTIRSLLIDGQWHAVAVVRDATGRRRAERRLERARKRAEEAVAEKDTYLSLIVHDLRSPFAAMITLLEMFERELTDHRENPLNRRFALPVRQLAVTARSALGMVEKVLLARNIKEGGLLLNQRRFDARRQAEESITLHRQMAALKGVELINDLPADTRLYGDPDLFLEVLNNLVGNAIKFCRTNDRITLTLPPDGHGVAVADTGIGIDDLIEGPSRSTRGTAGEKGHGLGLPLAARIMEAHNGSLTAERRPEGGSVFYARLPKPAPCALVACKSEAGICVAHDLLREMGADVARFSDKEGALSYLEEGMPDLVISGRLPARGEGEGEHVHNACSELRKADVPIIVCNKRVREGCARRASDGSLPPAVSEGLRRRIRDHLL